MLNHENYIQTIYIAINKNFSLLDKTIKSCERLQEARKAYYQALNEYHLGIDHQQKNQKQYRDKLSQTKEQIDTIQQDIGSYVCDRYHTIEPFTVGLFGEWGSGKTHLLKGLKSHIIIKQEAIKVRWQSTPNPDIDTVETFIVPIFFNAWRFEKDEHIIIPLFKTLLSELDNYDYIPRLKQIKTKIKILSFSLVKNLQMPQGLDIAKVFAGNFSSIDSIKSFFNWKGVKESVKKAEQNKDKNYLLEQLITSERIESIYLKIPQWIEKITIFDNVRFVFLIDDLDRCLPENTLKMLESMKLFLDVAGCSFVLAMDDDVIERGVEHHYRDYLQRHDNHIYINMPSQKESEEPKQTTTKSKEEHMLLPITGSEYLEKMIQLPFRIPPIYKQDVKEFLEQRYERFRPQELKPKLLQNDILEEPQNRDQTNQRLLEFFITNIPPKPRKIIRTINLFESKEELMRFLDTNPILLAKLTLLELFAPKLFRFMQTKGFVRIFNRLVKWKSEHNSLSETNKIALAISKAEFEQIDRDTFEFLRQILQQHYKSRVEFNLDSIFDEAIDEKPLISHITFQFQKRAKPNRLFRPLPPKNEKLFFDRILSSDELLWSDAFREDENLSIDGVVLDRDSFENLLYRLSKENRRNLVQNPIWLKNISIHLSDNDFKELLIRYNPFKGLKDE